MEMEMKMKQNMIRSGKLRKSKISHVKKFQIIAIYLFPTLYIRLYHGELYLRSKYI